MEVAKLNQEANKIWKKFASYSCPDRLHLDLDSYEKLLEFFQVGDSYHFIFNFDSCQFDFVSPEVEQVLGYPVSEMTMPFIMDKLHPDDQPWFLSFENSVVKFFSELPIKQ